MKYNWQYVDWPKFSYDELLIQELEREAAAALDQYVERTKVLSGNELLTFTIETAVEEGVQSASIEGEDIARKEVRSSLLNNLQFGAGLVNLRDIRAKGVANLMSEMSRDAGQALTETTVRFWHELLFRKYRIPEQ